MSLFDHYQFKLKIPGKQEYVIYPGNDDIEIKWERDRDFRFFRWDCETTLIIRNEVARNVLAFNDIADIEISANPCDKITLTIERRCKGETEFTEFWTGYLARPEKEFDTDACIVKVKPRTEDQYTCLLENWKLEKNILINNGGNIEAKTQIGTLKRQYCSNNTSGGQGFPGPYVSDCISGQYGWRVLSHQSTQFNTGGDILNETIWVREVVNGGTEPPGGGWQLEGAKWVRPPVLALRSIDNPDTTQPGPYIYYEQWGSLDYTIDNGVRLNDLLENLILGNCFNIDSVVSNFFGINPDGTQPNNEAYTSALQNLQDVVVWQITDIAKHNADNNATKGLLTLNKALKDLQTMFNVDFYIDSDGVFRLEHWSYFSKVKRLDLTQDGWNKFLKRNNSFTFDREKLPIKEIYLFPNETRYFFDGAPIEYEANCSDPQTEKTRKVELFMTDVEYILQNPEEYEESPLFVMANLANLNGSYYFTSEGNQIDSTPKLNGHLSWPSLQYHYHRHGRPQSRGRMNLQWQDFLSFQFIKLHKELEIPFGCCDIDAFEPEDMTKTNFGWCEIDEASYSLKTQVMTLNLRF